MFFTTVFNLQNPNPTYYKNLIKNGTFNESKKKN